MSAWKSFERWVCGLFNTERNPLSGGNGKHSRSDSLHRKLFISCKHTRKGHKTLFSLVAEETEKADAENKIPVVVLGRSGPGIGKREENTLIVIPAKFVKGFEDGRLMVSRD